MNPVFKAIVPTAAGVTPPHFVLTGRGLTHAWLIQQIVLLSNVNLRMKFVVYFFNKVFVVNFLF